MPTREPKWLNTSLEAKANRKNQRIATRARRASRTFGLWWRWSGEDIEKESHYFDLLTKHMSELAQAINAKDDRL